MGWLGTALILLGRYRLASKKTDAIIFGQLGELAWLISGIQSDRWDMIWLSIVLIGLDVRNVLAWRKPSISV